MRTYYFYTTGCFHCNSINEFIASSELKGVTPIDAGVFFNIPLTKKFKVEDTPTFVVTDNEDNILKKVDGYFDKDLDTIKSLLTVEDNEL